MAMAGATALIAAAVSCSSKATDDDSAAVSVLPKAILQPGDPDPMIASGVTIPSGATIYKTSGIGPEPGNPAAPEATPERYVDSRYAARLPPGVSLTEAQGINVLESIRSNLEQQGLSLSDVITMRVFLDSPPDAERADFEGWNRAYRQFFANTDIGTGDTELVPMGAGEPKAPIVRNPARPTRFALEVAALPVPGWLVEVEVDAVHPAST